MRHPKKVGTLSTASPTRSDQHTLFRCQRWHLSRMKEAEKILRHHERLAEERGLQFRGHLRRQIARHEKFIQAITPFVRLPL